MKNLCGKSKLLNGVGEKVYTFEPLGFRPNGDTFKKSIGKKIAKGYSTELYKKVSVNRNKKIF